MRSLQAALWVAAAAFAISCTSGSEPYQCSAQTNCTLDGIVGVCLQSTESDKHWCAYPDESCPGDWRWGILAGEGLAEECVANAIDAGPVDAVVVDAGGEIDGALIDAALIDAAAIDAAPIDAGAIDASTIDAAPPAPTCGNGVVDGNEVCDGNLLDGETCLSLGHDGGTLSCAANCLAFVETKCTDCGDGVLEAPEVCDGALLGGKTCVDVGPYSRGSLSCNNSCTAFVTTGCLGAPTVPKPLLPLSGSHSGSSNVGGSLRPTFKWTKSTVTGDTAIRYDLQYSLDKNFLTGVTTVTITSGEKHQPADDLAIATAAPRGATYFWHVRACAGNACSAYSSAYHVHVGIADHDFGGDGFADLAVRSPDFGSPKVGRIYVVPGKVAFKDATLAESKKVDGTAANPLGSGVLDAGDFNGDRYADLVVGYPTYDSSADNTGAVNVYLGGTTLGSQVRQLFGQAKDDEMGKDVAIGDFNNDGYDDLAISTPGFDGVASADVGRVDVYYGGPDFATDVTPERTYIGASSQILRPGIGAADLNGDGYSDLVIPVCAPAPSTCNASVYFGTSNLLPAASSTTIGGLDQLTGVGDVNADGFEEMIAYQDNCDLTGSECAGQVFLVVGGPSTVFATKKVNPGAGYSGERFGRTRAKAGDVNRDGFADFLVADATANTFRGAWFLYLGGAGLDTTSDRTSMGPEEYSMFGTSVCGGGDVNGDGFSDFGQSMSQSTDDGADVFFGATSPSATPGKSFREDLLPEEIGGTCSL